VILGLGIGAVTAMGSILYALAYRPLALPSPETLVGVSTIDARGATRLTPLPALERLREASLPVDGWCGYTSTLDALESGGRVERGFGQLMTADCVRVIGLNPALGRWFTAEEAPLTGTAAPVIVLTHGLWQRLFAGAPDAIGRTIRIQNTTVTVIGVMPEAYTGLSIDYDYDFILPFNAHRPSTGASLMIGRLRAGAGVTDVREQVRAMWRPVLDELLPPGPTREILAELNGDAQALARGESVLRRLYAAPVGRLTLVALALFVVVCVNVGGLMASRVSGRAHEIATMRALGAGGTRIGRLLAIECGLYACAGTALGLPLAYYGAGRFGALLPNGNAPWALVTTPDPVIIAAGVFVGVAMSLLIAAVPAWMAVSGSRRFDSQRTVAAPASRWTQVLLVTQIAATLALVFAGSLVVRSFHTLRTTDRGYDPNGLLSLRLSANPGGYDGMTPDVYYREVIERLRGLPGVRSAGLARYFGTVNARFPEDPVSVAGDADARSSAVTDFVSPGFFDTAGVPIRRGRDVDWTDLPSTARVAVLSESLARALDPAGDVVGRTIKVGTNPARAALLVVGVVGNVSIGNVRENDVRVVYLPSLQAGETTFATVHLRVDANPMRLAGPASEAIRALGREHVMGAYAKDFLFMNSMIPERMGAVVSGAAAGLALILSCIGLFALLSQAVRRRTREIGIRMAVGASGAAVARLVMRQALTLVLAGLILGLPAAVAAASLVRALLYGVGERDLTMMGLSVAALLVTATAAALVPMRRAVGIDPATALRAE
jgi:putative ABC transport system permease protein